MPEFVPNGFPVVERITQNLVAALQQITKSNGYDRDVRRVERVRAMPANVEDMLIAVYRDDPESATSKDGGATYGKGVVTQPYSVVYFVSESEHSGVPIDQRLALLEADVIKAVMKDPRRGDLAHVDTVHVGAALFPEPINGCSGGAVFFDVQYRTPRNDPYRIA